MSQHRSKQDDSAEYRERIREIIEEDRELLDALST